MNTSLNIQKTLIIFGIPLFIIALMVLLTHSSFFTTNSNTFSLAITVDLLLTVPFVYFLLIRKTTIPKTTVILFIIAGVFIGTFTLPIENQQYLNGFKTWILPIIELAILSYVIYKLVKTTKLYKANKSESSGDFFSILKSTCHTILPKAAVTPVATEIAVIYYGFIYWKRRKLKSNEFSYHKDSGTISLLIALIFLIAIETVSLHLLLAKWNITAAWILTGISIYSGIQILGFLKSMYKRPIIVEANKLHLRYGIMNETIINIEDIDSVELSTKDIEVNKTTRKLSFLGNLEGHNVVIRLKNEAVLTSLYGIKRNYTVLAFYVDNKQDFKNLIEQKIETLTKLPIS